MYYYRTTGKSTPWPTRNVLGRAAGDPFDQTDVRVLSGPADLVMLDIAMELFNGADAQRGFANTADAFNKELSLQRLCSKGNEPTALG